jgi:ABC-type Fe3+-siderophore transport system permease subunit
VVPDHLSAGATLSLVNVTLASQTGDSFLSQVAMVLTGLAIGGLVGAFNGFFVAYMRLQAVVKRNTPCAAGCTGPKLMVKLRSVSAIRQPAQLWRPWPPPGH